MIIDKDGIGIAETVKKEEENKTLSTNVENSKDTEIKNLVEILLDDNEETSIQNEALNQFVDMFEKEAENLFVTKKKKEIVLKSLSILSKEIGLDNFTEILDQFSNKN